MIGSGRDAFTKPEHLEAAEKVGGSWLPLKSGV
jgi:hypothetical protein